MSEIIKAIKALCEEKNLSLPAVMEAIEMALAAAYRKDFGNRQQNIKVKYDPEKNTMEAWDVKTVVEDIDEDVLEQAQEELSARREQARHEERELTDEEIADLPRFNPKLELMLSEAKKVKKTAKVGDVLEIVLELPSEFGRMAAQTAKQVIIQKVREAERNMVFDDFKEQEGEIVMGAIQRVEGRKVLVDIGKVTGILPSDRQIRRDIYRPGARMKFLVVSVEMTARGPQIILSRNDNVFVEEVFRQEIPEIAEGTIQIKGIAREAGFRSKVAVYTEDESIDPIGSCIGQRGSRINTIIEEMGGEKVDVINYSDKIENYIGNSLSPAKVLDVKLDEANKEAEVFVAPEQFSLAIGRGGQNVRLAAQLTGWNLKVKEDGGDGKELSSEEIDAKEVDPATEEEKTNQETVSTPPDGQTEETMEEKPVKEAKKITVEE
ncbi:MAG: transcription termination/antitermination protein NusA [Candidatus Magasanikbacteria bacterium CG10_big_fil_rev_8_21_14_0_10_40_10]|uniref:Transcription termination/antitermination protein NusA n=1 Tax=Candidatus Magasanikbacteria bacterium CG10_big_fil_rev_8_21_14_0_10_40_10 TaxID=1974648 RepID=A0A2M6W2U1_9BACT|nr:MAG: transcription termination/antitermination protein NusA [Candidatus Magasanikbacteria bacterium CG10_big_fil_rev_8_21_14_0_10_40_10]